MPGGGLIELGVGVITQAEVEAVISLDAQIHALRLLRDRKCAQLLDRLLSGCPLEAGSHTVTIEAQDRGARRTYYLGIDGRSRR